MSFSGLDFYNDNIKKLKGININLIHRNCPISKENIIKYKSGLIFLYSLVDKLFQEATFYKSRIELLEKENSELMARLEENEVKIPVVLKTDL